MNKRRIVSSHFDEHAQLLSLVQDNLSDQICKVASTVSSAIAAGSTIFFCGNGGSAADAQHLAAELVGRFKRDRPPLRSIALTTDSSVLTCIANDYSYEMVFSRQLEALATSSDVLIAISTSGNSPNIIKVLEMATSMHVHTICLLGNNGGQALQLSDTPIVVPSSSTARIQEMHGLIGHILCDLIEEGLTYD